MGKRDPRVDAYLAKAPPFAKPILDYIRETVHSACPRVEETVKWSMPHFDYKGMLCSMAAFKGHCALSFWKASLLIEASSRKDGAMGQMGRITSVADLPSKRELTSLIKTAMALNEEGVRVVRKVKPKPSLEIPEELAAALRKNAKARATFNAFSESHKREYAEWIVEAKRDETRQRRVAQAIEWMAEGKARNWKYEKC